MENGNEPCFNKFQWSKFHGEGEQTVIRGNDWKQFCLDVDAAKALINPTHIAPKQEPPAGGFGYGTIPVTTGELPEPCLKCQVGQMIYKTGVKNGRPWAGRFCNKCDNKSWVNLKN